VIFGSVCSGIEAASVAWHPLGWRAAWLAEIEPFPSAVLAHHYPGVPNHGDFTKLLRERPSDVDVLVGGTPCQSFSVAGLRGGLTDHRGNLALAFMALVDVLRPRWVVWENVPGVLSSHGGRDFGSILGALGKLGYGFAYRVLDAQYFGLAQRRKRVFVVGHLGDWRRAAAVLFEPESVRRDSPPRREAGARAAGSLGTGATDGGGWRVGADEAAAGHVVPAPRAYGGNCATERDVSTALNAKGGASRMDFESETFVAVDLQNTTVGGDVAGTLDTSRPGRVGGQAVFALQDVRPRDKAQNGRGWSDDGTAYTVDAAATQGVAIGPIPFDTTQITSAANRSRTGPGDPCHPIAAGAHAPAIAYQCHGSNVGEMGTLRKGSGSVTGGVPFVAQAFNWQSGGDCRGLDPQGTSGALTKMQTPATLSPYGVRRLTPREMERLQGFPDDYTLLPVALRKPIEDDYFAYLARTYPEMSRSDMEQLSKDGPRAKALGNSMAVPVMRWIGQRIALVDGVP
jgi:DNA (cytosine-5)-methyltransferase 1